MTSWVLIYLGSVLSNLSLPLHTFTIITECPTIFDHSWSGVHVDWMCISWPCTIHHYAVSVPVSVQDQQDTKQKAL